MRRINSDFKTAFISEEGQKFSNRDYFGFVEMDDFACYVLADSLDNETSSNSAQLVVESIIRNFVEKPTLRKTALEKYIYEAHKELKKARGGMHLKASVIVAATDYRKLRFTYVGNSRLYLLRNSRIIIKTKDQSLAMNLADEGKIESDKAARHEERNNLYSYLGGREMPHTVSSGRIPLNDGDILEIMTRGIWENCSDQELLDNSKDAKDPGEILNKIEDLVLSRQSEHFIDNYSLAITFIDKVYRSPKKKVSLKQVLMVAVPAVVIVGGVGLTLYLRHRNKVRDMSELEFAMENGEEYLRYDNYEKAAEQYKTAVDLAKDLNKDESLKEADENLKLSEQIILADEAMLEQNYEKAQELYLKARELSRAQGNTGSRYIDSRLKETRNYMEVYDLIELGDAREENGNMDGAIEAFKEARDLASSIYFSQGKEEAMNRQAEAEEKIDKANEKEEEAMAEAEAEAKEEAAKQMESEAMEQELLNQQKANDQKNAIDLENEGNELLKSGQFESAITYYQTAQAIYIRLELADLADNLNSKIEAAKAGSAAKAAMENGSEANTENIMTGNNSSGPLNVNDDIDPNGTRIIISPN